MAKKRAEQVVQVEPNAGGYRRCADCGLSFRHTELFDQHRALGCKPRKSDGPTWSEKSTEDTPQE